MHVTELSREHWPGTIINNVSASSHVEALQYLQHSQKLTRTVQVGCCHFPRPKDVLAPIAR